MSWAVYGEGRFRRRRRAGASGIEDDVEGALHGGSKPALGKMPRAMTLRRARLGPVANVSGAGGRLTASR